MLFTIAKTLNNMKYTYALHHIVKREVSENSLDFSTLHFGFDPSSYSKFKFGDKDAARVFGYELARNFIQSSAWKEIKETHKNFVILSSPYCFIPTATFSIVNYFLQFINQHLVEIGYPVAEKEKIHRTITYKEDYGELSAEKRLALIQNDGFHIDTEFIKGKFLIFIDDIKITGSHEKVIERMIAEHNIENDHAFLYFAKLADSTIDPRVENYLNYFYVKNLLDLDKIIKNKTFLANTRVIKYVLNYKDKSEFKTFANYQAKKILSTFYHLAIGNSYHLIPEYQENLSYIKELLIKYNHFVL